MNTVSNGSSIAESSITVCDQSRTAELLDFHKLVDAITGAAAELDAEQILSPERMVVPLGNGGVLLSMPATASDIGIHKLVNVQPTNVQRKLPTINGTVTVCDAETGKILCLLDGPEVTGRRTAAVTMLAIRTLSKDEPKSILLYGTGAQAAYHVKAINALYPHCTIWARGLDEQNAREFCERNASHHGNIQPCPEALPQDIDVVITVTTSTTPVYNELAKAGRLIIGVGAFKPEMAELGKVTLDGSDLYADEPAGARHEAGDLLRANIDWSRVSSLAAALRTDIDYTRPAVFKSVGTAAWDLAAARVALQALSDEQA